MRVGRISTLRYVFQKVNMRIGKVLWTTYGEEKALYTISVLHFPFCSNWTVGIFVVDYFGFCTWWLNGQQICEGRFGLLLQTWVDGWMLGRNVS